MPDGGIPTLNPALHRFWHTPARIRTLYGGRSSSKTWDAAGFAVFLANRFKLRCMCTRQFQNRIDESVHPVLCEQIRRFGLEKRFEIQARSIVNKVTGAEFLFYGLWRNINEVKGTEGLDILWIEEGEALTKEQYRVLEPTMRKNGSQIWVIFNPHLITDFVWRYFVVNPPARSVVRRINYDENPFLSETILHTINELRQTDFDEWQHIYGGEPMQDDEGAVIKRSWILAAIDAQAKLGLTPGGAKILGFDVADSGKDKCALVSRHGSLINWTDLWKAGEDELLRSCTRAYHAARERGASINYDSIGVGATAGAKFGELNEVHRMTGLPVDYAKFNAGGAIFRPEALYTPQTKNKDMFSNLKAQAWWMTADRFRNTYNAVRKGEKFADDEMIFIDSGTPNMATLIDELSTPKRDYDNNGRVKVESKKDLEKRDVPSPNLADAAICAFAPGVTPMVISDDVVQNA